MVRVVCPPHVWTTVPDVGGDVVLAPETGIYVCTDGSNPTQLGAAMDLAGGDRLVINGGLTVTVYPGSIKGTHVSATLISEEGSGGATQPLTRSRIYGDRTPIREGDIAYIRRAIWATGPNNYGLESLTLDGVNVLGSVINPADEVWEFPALEGQLVYRSLWLDGVSTSVAQIADETGLLFSDSMRFDDGTRFDE